MYCFQRGVSDRDSRASQHSELRLLRCRPVASTVSFPGKVKERYDSGWETRRLPCPHPISSDVVYLSFPVFPSSLPWFWFPVGFELDLILICFSICTQAGSPLHSTSWQEEISRKLHFQVSEADWSHLQQSSLARAHPSPDKMEGNGHRRKMG